MKSFFKSILASCLGSLLAFTIIVIALFAVISYYTAQPKSNQKGVLHIPFSGVINDYTSNSFDFSQFDFSSEPSISLYDLRKILNAAAEDDGISAVFMEFKECQISQQMVSEISQLVNDFKSTGKKVYCYSNYYDQNAYLLSTFSDSIFLNPNGGINLRGYGIYAPFFNTILDQFDIDINIYYAGKYKSSTEPYRLDSFSLENEEQLRDYLGQLQSNMNEWIKVNRGIETSILQEKLDLGRTYDADFLFSNGFVDGVMYRDEVIDQLNKNKASFVKFSEYDIHEQRTSDSVALVFAQGEIIWDGMGTGISHQQYQKIFKQLREDKKIKKVIFRIDSPGGNGYTSDLIHREIELLKNEGKKVYASFGAYATSGGYFIASACDSIFATDNTMTGSIGVYIMLPSIDDFLEKQLSIGIDTVLSREGAIAYNPIIGISEKEAEGFQNQADRLYELFLKRVANGRQMSKAEVHEVAQGRIWSGARAIEHNLVDDLLTLDELITKHSPQAEPQIYPKQNSSIAEELLNSRLEKFANTQNHEIKWFSEKVIEFQKLIETPSPMMRILPSINVTNR